MLKRLLPILLTSALMLVPTSSVSRPSHPRLFESVRPLQQVDMDRIDDLPDDGVDPNTIHNICSTFYINSQKHYWLTAAHCVEDPTLPFLIDGQPATIEVVDVKHDIAILSTPLPSTARPLRLASRPPSFCTEREPEKECQVRVVGHPFGWPEPILTYGYIMHPSLQVFDDEGWDIPYMIYQVTAAPGSSGSAVVNWNGEVISVLQWGYGRSFGSVDGGVTWDVLDEEFREYFGG